MAVEVNTAGEAINRLSAMAPQDGDYTVCFWVRATGSVGASYRTAIVITNGVATYTDGIWIGSGDVAASWQMDVFASAVSHRTVNIPITLTTYLHLAYVRSGTNQTIYINGQPFESIALDLSAVPFTELWLGHDDFGTATGMRFAYFREWTAALSSAELVAELQATAAVRSSGLFTDCPLTADLLDVSGNGHDFAAVGAIGFVADPTIPVAPIGTGVYPLPNTASNELFRILDLPTITDFTIMGWARPDNLASTNPQFFLFEDDGASTTLLVWALISLSHALQLRITDGFTIVTDNGTTSLVLSEWVHIVFWKSGTTYRVYLSTEDGSVDASLECELVAPAVDLTGLTRLNLMVGQRVAFQNVKAWEAALSVLEIQAERPTAVAIRTANLYMETPLQGGTDLGDVSGLVHPWFPNGEVQNAPPPDLFGGPAPPPDAPSNLQVTYDAVLGRVTLTWDDNSSDETGFQVWQCLGETCEDFTLLTSPAANNTSIIFGVEPNTCYRFKVRATGIEANSDFSNIAAICTDPIESVRFFGTPGNYWHASPGLHYPWQAVPLGNGTAMVWIKPDNTGTATIFAVIDNFMPTFYENIPVADQEQWNFDNPNQSYVWFGLRNGRLTADIYDSRIPVRKIGVVQPKFYGIGFGGVPCASCIANRTADISTFNATWATGPKVESDYIAPVPFEEVDAGGDIYYYCTFPLGSSTIGGGLDPASSEQFLRVTGPEIPNGVWSRVGFRWTTDFGIPFVSTVELLLDCAVCASGNWDDINVPSDNEFLGFWVQSLGGTRIDLFVGSTPNATALKGGTPVSFSLYDFKLWSRAVSDESVAGECDCEGITPNLWWKMRQNDDRIDYGSGVGISVQHYDVLEVGTASATNGEPPLNPCNGPGPGGGGNGNGGGGGGGEPPSGEPGCPPDWPDDPVTGQACAPDWHV